MITDTDKAAPSQHFEHVACPKCGVDDSSTVIIGKDRLHAIGDAYYVTECRRCGLWFQNPRPNAEQVGSLYPENYAPYAESQAVTPLAPHPASRRFLSRQLSYHHLHSSGEANGGWRAFPALDPVRQWLAGVNLTPRFVPGGRLLEIGCGNGTRLATLRVLGWEQLYGLELSSAATEIARRQGFMVEAGPVEETLDRFPDNFFDVVVSSMVFEHLFNPFETMRRVARKLRPGGQLLLSTINRQGLDATMYGTYWRNLDLPRHMVFFRTEDLRAMLADQFEHIETFYQAAPLDLVGSASYRAREQAQPIDRLLMAAGERWVYYVSLVLALFGATSRVSVRCLRRGELVVGAGV
jgi:2-polyprenyl-3-methyl-5-hydroxy-6-metoxy-1,4-benzoquinol methylase